jgi:hypothetical protein
MERKKYHWIIGINPITKRVETRRNDSRNPYQAEGLTSVRTHYGTKVPKQMEKDMLWALRILYP